MAHLILWESAACLHTASQPHEKLHPKRKKSMFKRYLEGSKCYIILGERANSGLTEIEPHYVDFLE